MHRYPLDIFTGPEPDVDALANLGPLAPMANPPYLAAGNEVGAD
ncbi:MAG: hypothetical protein ABI886_12825 [Betaproteobacteria bacterium]